MLFCGVHGFEGGNGVVVGVGWRCEEKGDFGGTC